MKTTRSRLSPVLPALCCAAWGCAAPHAAAQSAYPSRNVQIIVPYTAGGSIDIISRVLAQRLAEAWGKNVVIDNEGAEPWPQTPAQLSDLLPREIERYRKAAKVAGIAPQ